MPAVTESFSRHELSSSVNDDLTGLDCHLIMTIGAIYRYINYSLRQPKMNSDICQHQASIRFQLSDALELLQHSERFIYCVVSHIVMYIYISVYTN